MWPWRILPILSPRLFCGTWSVCVQPLQNLSALSPLPEWNILVAEHLKGWGKGCREISENNQPVAKYEVGTPLLSTVPKDSATNTVRKKISETLSYKGLTVWATMRPETGYREQKLVQFYTCSICIIWEVPRAILGFLTWLSSAYYYGMIMQPCKRFPFCRAIW